jgi:hypothetical protein
VAIGDKLGVGRIRPLAVFKIGHSLKPNLVGSADCEPTSKLVPGRPPVPYLSTRRPQLSPRAGAVPIWAMMILGFAGIGFMAYRRRSKPTFRFA